MPTIDQKNKKILEDLSRAYIAYITLRQTIDLEMAEERKRRLANARVAPALLAAKAHAAGVPVNQIAKFGLGTKARQTAYALIEEGTAYAAPDPTPAATAAEFAWADARRGEITVTPAEADLDKYAKHAGVAAGAYPSAVFRIATTDDGDAYAEAVTAPLTDDGTPHPVVMLVQRDPAYAARVVEWAAEAA